MAHFKVTFESELYAVVLGCKQFGDCITVATVNYPPSGMKSIALWSDSTTALSQWSQIKLPTTVMEYLSAKSRRFFSWADKKLKNSLHPVLAHCFVTSAWG